MSRASIEERLRSLMNEQEDDEENERSMSAIIDRLRSIRDALAPFRELIPVKPVVGSFYLTLNDSLVYVFGTDDDGDARALVLRGGHGVSSSSGEKPGERYFLDGQGYFRTNSPEIELVMSLKQQISLRLDLGNDELTPATIPGLKQELDT